MEDVSSNVKQQSGQELVDYVKVYSLCLSTVRVVIRNFPIVIALALKHVLMLRDAPALRSCNLVHS